MADLPDDPLIIAENLSKHFGRTPAVENVSFTVHSGEIVGFMGPNGAGKSTTMRLLTGYLPADSGRAYINGHAVDTDPLSARRAVGYLPEQGGLYTDITVSEYLNFMARAHHVPNPAKAIDIVATVTRCIEFRHRPLDTLSKGMRQRVFLAGALIHEPPVLLLDEPTDGLDPNQKFELRMLLRKLAKRKGILISTHILEEAEAVCDRVIIIAGGRIIADETPALLAKRAGGDIQAAFRKLTGTPFAQIAAGKEGK